VRWLVIGLNRGSTVLSSIFTTVKKSAAARVPAVLGGGLGGPGRFARGTAATPLWLTALLADLGGVGLQMMAMHFGALALVQPLLVSGVAVHAAAAPPAPSCCAPTAERSTHGEPSCLSRPPDSGGQPDAPCHRGAVEDLARRSRAPGIGVTLIT